MGSVTGSDRLRLGSLVDGRGRALTYLRIALTERCDLRCQYCMPGGPASASRDEGKPELDLPRLADAALVMIGGQ